MKSIISKAMMLVAVAAALFSFTANFGGEGYEIYMNGKLLLQQFGKDMNSAKTIRLGQTAPDDKLIIKYWHCGRSGKNRSITIRDQQDKLLKEWHYPDAGNSSAMSCSLKELFGLRKTSNVVLKLYYSSTELPQGRMLVAIDPGPGAIAGIK